MFQVNEFPPNILAALDALAKLGKAIKNKAQAGQVINFQIIERKKQARPTNKKTHLNKKRAGK